VGMIKGVGVWGLHQKVEGTSCANFLHELLRIAMCNVNILFVNSIKNLWTKKLRNGLQSWEMILESDTLDTTL